MTARKALCDNCQKGKPDCLWTLRVESGQQYLLCGSCRDYWRLCGHALRNVDPDYGVRPLQELDVESGEESVAHGQHVLTPSAISTRDRTR